VELGSVQVQSSGGGAWGNLIGTLESMLLRICILYMETVGLIKVRVWVWVELRGGVVWRGDGGNPYIWIIMQLFGCELFLR
jgi:hypothetical protein